MNIIKHIKDVLSKKSTLLKPRSSKWSSLRKSFLLNNPKCQCCGSRDKLEVHHIQSFHEHPELELDVNNLMVLCESKKYGLNCHLEVGHQGNYKKTNPNAREDAGMHLAKFLNK